MYVPPLLMVTLSTPPLAMAVASKPGVGLPPVIETVGAEKPNPVSSTLMLLTTPVEISAPALAGLAGTFKDIIYRAGGEIPQDPFDQVMAAVEAVFRSSYNDKAMIYKEKHGLPPQGQGLSHRARAFVKLAEVCLGRP